MSDKNVSRRKLGRIISDPVLRLAQSPVWNHVAFIEKDRTTAQKTRAAALMFIGRNELGLTTSVKDDVVWVLKDKDIIGEGITIDLRS